MYEQDLFYKCSIMSSLAVGEMSFWPHLNNWVICPEWIGISNIGAYAICGHQCVKWYLWHYMTRILRYCIDSREAWNLVGHFQKWYRCHQWNGPRNLHPKSLAQLCTFTWRTIQNESIYMCIYTGVSLHHYADVCGWILVIKLQTYA